MKRGQLQGVAARVGRFASESAVSGQLVAAYFLHNDRWYLAESADEVGSAEAEELRQAWAAKAAYFRLPKSVEVYFKHPEFSAVSKISFVSRPASKTISRFQASLQSEILNAKNEFLAKHDPLTECLNKAALDEILSHSISGVGVTDKKSSGSGRSAISQLKSAYLISMDLDHFKSINDNYGHLYGDVVLRAFSWRVDATLNSWISALEVAGVESFLARPGGEEFQIVVSGPVGVEQIVDLAEQIRVAISAEPLPSRGEHEVLKADGKVATDVFPAELERGVTVSIGIGVLEVRSGERDGHSISRMLREADLALYSAKGGGRNTVRIFSSILRDHIRTIDYIPETQLIAIDAGGEVGVKLGQEFIVYPPRFDGETSYFSGEGRSRRKLGKYPRFPVARISVVNVQPDVAFCKVDDWIVENGRNIPAGSSLQAVPLGSISHLVSTTGGANSKLVTSVELIRAQLKEDLAVRRSTATFLLQGLHDLASARGLRVANAMLALVFDAIVESIPGRGHVAMIADNAFVVASKSDDEESFLKEVTSSAEKLARIAAGQVEIRTGIFYAKSEVDIPSACGIEFSMLAAIDAKSEDVVVFDEFVASRVVGDAIIDQKYDKARADLDKLFDFGYRRVSVLNQAGLLEFYSQNYDLAQSFFKEAREASGNDPVLALNEATAFVELRRWSDAIALYKEHFESVQDSGAYLGAYALSGLALLESGSSLVAYEDIAVIVERASNKPVSELVAIDRASHEQLKFRIAALGEKKHKSEVARAGE